jgi:hypothetical protein
MIDDDTYLLMDNLVEYLQKFDSSRPYYIGSSTVFMGCDGVRNFGDGPAFAHGGSGIILSRAAVEKMLTIKDDCIWRYKDCWAGDIRLGLCLRDVGIFLESPGLFTKHPPNDNFFYGDPCTKQISFHHLLISQFQRLYQVELKNNGTRPVTLSDIAPSFLREGITSNTNRPGGDYDHFAEPSVEGCYERCRKDRKCYSFVHANSVCWLKSVIPDVKEEQGTTSGVVLSNYVCRH